MTSLAIINRPRPIARAAPRHMRMIVAVLIVAVVVLVALIVSLSRNGSHTLNLRPHIGEYNLVSDGGGKPLQQEIAESLGKAFASRHSTGVIAGVYSNSSAATEGVIIAGGPKGDFGSISQQVTSYATAQVAAAKAGGFPTFPVIKAQTYSGGSFGGSVACTTSEASDQGIPYSLCAWTDSGTEGYALSNDLKPSQLASALALLRKGFES